MKILVLLTLLMCANSWANLHLAPPDFNTKYGRAIFTDFKKAVYNIHYDVRNEETTVRTLIHFRTTQPGLPVFDLVPDVLSAYLDGEKVKTHEIDFPGGDSELRIVDRKIQPGDHTLEVINEFDTNVDYDYGSESVSSAFWIRDLRDRKFLEQYIPSNFEFDQYRMNFEVSITGQDKPQEIFTNGLVTKKALNSWSIEFPAHFTVSCPFFHTAPKGKMFRKDFTYPSKIGRDIPITVYSPKASKISEFKAEVISVMAELEDDYGAWGHPSFIAYATPPNSGGMEYAGATVTSITALDHEMLHSYFAKGVMPANGNSGWIDEAIASWRDKGYQRTIRPDFSGSNLGSQSAYKRNTDDRAYKLGNAFLSYVDYRLQDMGGLKSFLKGYFQAYKKTVITTEHFKNNLEFFSGLDLSRDFDTYIWGKNYKNDSEDVEVNPHHPHLSTSQLKALL